MPIEIRKAGERFGPHTLEELKVFLMQGDIEMSDTVLTEERQEMSVGDYLQQPHTVKLKLATPAWQAAAPAAPAVPPPLPPRALRPPPLSALANSKPTARSAGFWPWLATGLGVAVILINFVIIRSTPDAAYNVPNALGQALGQSVLLPLIAVAIQGARQPGRNARSLSRAVILGLLLSLGIAATTALQQAS